MIRYRKPHRFKRKKSIIKNRFFWLGLFIFILFICISYFLFFSGFFRIEHVVVFGNKKVLKEEITKVAEEGLLEKTLFFPTKNIFLVNLKEMKEDILSSFPQIEGIEIKRTFPRTLALTIIERKGVAQICKTRELFTKDETEISYEKCFLLDKEGIVFEEVLEDNLYVPKLKNPNLKDELKLGVKVIDETLLSKVSDIFSNLEDLNILTKEFSLISDERINIKTSDGWEIYLNPNKNLNWQLTKLKAVLRENIPSEKRKDLEYIELRFGNSAPFKYRETNE